MAAKTQITNKGLELLASSSKATGQHWWIGWYALAFVPDELQDESGEKLGPNMTKLTEEGDIIYNIFQGDMNGDGYQTTKASDKFKAVNYDSNIKKNYRYVLDEDGRNNLVTFVDGKNGLKGACVYPGVKVNESRDDNSIDYAKSKIPLPAPLLYTGVLAAGEGWSTNGMNIFLGTGNDRIENFYPVDKDSSDLTIPRVSADFRNYEGYKNGLPDEIEEGGEQGYAYALTDITDEGVDFDGWFPSVNTYTQNDDPTMDYNQFCRQYWKVLSISNFNKYCAPVNASGLLYDENTGCRNMAKATKYFPISDYSVTSTAKTADNEYATGIKLKVQLKLNGNAEDGAYFKDVEMADEENVATLNPEATQEEHQLFNTKQVSFKFNRIGIYAVPMRQYGCSDDSTEMKAQYQIDTEAEPVLFAVCEWDSPVTLSDSGEGLSEFQSDVFIDLSAAVEDSSVIRESAVFYNLYEDDAIDWYKNQLLANASMAEALVNMQIEMGYLRNQKNAKQGCCPKQEAIQQKEKYVAGLRNLVDARDYNSNSVRNRLAQEEGKPIPALYSDSLPHFGGIGYPQTSSSKTLLARFTEGAGSSQDFYSAFYGYRPDSSLTPTYANALFDGNEYLDMVPSINTDGETDTTRIGKLWVRTNLYYEMFTFIKPNTQDGSITYDYPDDAETNNFANAVGKVTDWAGEGAIEDYRPYITVTKTASGIETDDDGVKTPNYPTELASRSDFVAEITRSFENYETQRSYTVYYVESASVRDYTGFKFKRTATLNMPKIQLYKIDKLNSYDKINQRLASTGWRIPTTADWNEIIANSTADKINKIRSTVRWAGMTGGTGGVCPIGGAMTGRGGTTLRTTTPDGTLQAVYLAIGDDDTHVVVFNGFTFSIIPTPNFADSESGLSYVAVLCVGDAVKIFDGKAKSKLGYDSYALMEGSASEGDHNFNAAKNSIISETANYNSILSGMNNVVIDSDHNTVLNGFSNELLGSVHSLVLGDTNTLKKTSAGIPTCRMLVAATNTTVIGGATSAIIAEKSTVESAYHTSILGASLDIKSIYCARVVGELTESNRGIYYSDIIAYGVHHMPATWMSRVTLTNDGVSELPSSLQYDVGTSLFYSDITGNQSHFWSKRNAPTEKSGVYHSRVALTSAGIIHSSILYSDVSADGYGYGGNCPYQNSWFKDNTLEALNICHSIVKLYSSSIATNYVNGSANESNILFSDISLGYSIMQMTSSSGTHSIAYGVMKLSESSIALCDCSYIYESGTKHYLSSSTIKFATLVGQMISLSGSTFNNLHIYGSLTLASSINNQLILGGLDGTTIGPHNSSASNYISEFGSFITGNSKNYPMIWSLGGIGLFMNKMVLGNKDVSGGAPAINDVLTVVGTEDNVATVAWKPGGGSAGMSQHTIITDFDLSELTNPLHPDQKEYNVEPITSMTGFGWDKLTIVRPNQSGFKSVADDIGIVGSTWYGPYSSDDKSGLFRFGESNVVDWYKWHSLSVLNTKPTDHVVEWVTNSHMSLYVDFNDLKPGVVYEVNIHIVQLPTGPYSVDTLGTAMQQAYPDEVVSNPSYSGVGGKIPSMNIQFYNPDNSTCQNVVCFWGSNAVVDSTYSYGFYPKFHKHSNVASYPTSTRAHYSLVDIAVATIRFVKLDGKIYVMSY